MAIDYARIIKNTMGNATEYTAPSSSNSGTTWYLSNWTSDGRGTWASQPVLTINGQQYRFNTPQEYIAKLQELKGRGLSGPLDQYIQQFQGAVPEWESSIIRNVSSTGNAADAGADTGGASRGPANSDQGGYVPDPNNPGGPWIPDPNNTPADNPPGYVFNPQQRQGSAQDLLGNYETPAGLRNNLDVRRLFPWLSDPQGAAQNTLAQAGFNTGVDNPFTSFLEGELPQMANIARIQNIMAGGRGHNEDIQANAPRMLGGGITRSHGEGLMGGLVDMARRAQRGMGQLTDEQKADARAVFANPAATAADRERVQGYLNPGGLTFTQGAYADRYLTDPEEALKLRDSLLDLAPDLRQSQRRISQNRLRQFGNVAGGMPNASIWDFLGY